MEKHANVDHSDQQPRFIEKPIEVQLLAADGQTATVRIVDISPDSAGLSSPTELSLTSGQDVRILLTTSSRRFAIVQHAVWFGADYHIGVRWNCAHHRDAVRAAVLLSDYEALSDSSIRFHTNLPDLLYDLWQLMDDGRLRVLADVIVQFEIAARIAGHDLAAKCQELRDAIEIAAPDEFVANVLDELCKECVAQIVRRKPDTPHSTPVMVSDSLSANVERPKDFLGASGWVVGTVVVLAGHLLTII